MKINWTQDKIDALKQSAEIFFEQNKISEADDIVLLTRQDLVSFSISAFNACQPESEEETTEEVNNINSGWEIESKQLPTLDELITNSKDCEHCKLVAQDNALEYIRNPKWQDSEWVCGDCGEIITDN